MKIPNELIDDYADYLQESGESPKFSDLRWLSFAFGWIYAVRRYKPRPTK